MHSESDKTVQSDGRILLEYAPAWMYCVEIPYPGTSVKTAKIQKRPFVHNSVCSQFVEGVRNSVELLLIEIQEEIHHFAGLGGGG